MQPTLVILAAGMGSRFGGLKQMVPIGPSGETLMDYSIFDAKRAGFGRVVFIIRREMDTVFRDEIGGRYAGHIAVDYAYQELDDLPGDHTVPAGRTKPWGTGQAVLAAREIIREPFAVANADDFYGQHAFQALGEFLAASGDDAPPTYALVAYPLRDTLTEAGTVNRGVCQTSADGWLERIVEVVGIETHGDGGRVRQDDGGYEEIAGDTPVSMNLWGFAPVVLQQLQASFEAFLAERGGEEKSEHYLPAAIQEAVVAGQARVRALATSSRWCGVTHREDQPRVEQAIRQLIATGQYPNQLWR